MTKFICSSQYDGPLSITTENSDGEQKRFNYVFMRDRDYATKVVWSIYRVGVDGRLGKTGYSIAGIPTEDEPMVEVWADGTDMPEEMAAVLVRTLYHYYPFVLDSTEHDDNGGVISYKYEALIPQGWVW